MSDCERRGLFGKPCRFEPRYDLGLPVLPPGVKEASPEALREFRPKTYLHDICVACGKVVQRPKEPV